MTTTITLRRDSASSHEFDWLMEGLGIYDHHDVTKIDVTIETPNANPTGPQTMTTATTEKVSNNTAEGQRILREFVGREVIYCVSMLVDDILKGNEGDCWDGIDNLYIPTCTYCGDTDLGAGEGNECPECEMGECGVFESQLQEVMEWWIVSNWLLERLRKRGEVVCDDFHGLPIWGRCGTGQAIYLDCYIEDIYNELHSK